MDKESRERNFIHEKGCERVYVPERVRACVCVCVSMEMLSNKYLTTTVHNIANTDLYTLVPTLLKYKSMCRDKERKRKNFLYKIKTVLVIKLEKKREHGRVVLQKNLLKMRK